MKFTWIKGKPTKRGFYVLDLGYKFLRSDMGYQHHYASAFSDGDGFLSSTLNGEMIKENIEGYAMLPEADYKTKDQPELKRAGITLPIEQVETVAGLIECLAAGITSVDPDDVFAPEVNNLAITLALQCPHLITARDDDGNPMYPTVCQIFNQHRESQ